MAMESLRLQLLFVIICALIKALYPFARRSEESGYTKAWKPN